MKRIFFTIAIITSIFFASCDSQLDVENQSGTFASLSNPQDLLFGAYFTLLDEDLLSIVNESLRSDLGYAVGNVSSDNDFGQLFRQQLNLIPQALNNKWNIYYAGILRANSTIDRLRIIEEENGALLPSETYILAQARFLRGLYHFYAHSLFNNGRIIIRDEPTIVANAFKSASPSEEVINFFRADLEFAYDNLFLASETVSKSIVSKGFAAVVLGTSYLYEGDYNTAIQYLTDSSLDEYSLLTGSNVLNMYDVLNHNETIFEILYSTNEFFRETNPFNISNGITDATSAAARAGFGGGRAPTMIPPAWLAHEYANEAMDYADSRNVVGDSVSLRARAMCVLVQDTLDTGVNRYYGAKYPLIATRLEGANAYAFYKKYTNHQDRNQEIRAGQGNEVKSEKHVIVSRLADVYLMLAECYIQTNQLPLAADLINQIRTRWGLLPLADIGVDVTDQTEMMNHLMYVEKPLELAAEGHSIRNIDIRRWGIGIDRWSDLSTQTFAFESFTYNLPDDPGGPVNRNGVPVPNTRNNRGSKVVEGTDVNQYEGISYGGDYLPVPVQELNTNPNF